MKKLKFDVVIEVEAADENETHEEALAFLNQYFNDIYGNWSINGSESVTFNSITPRE